MAFEIESTITFLKGLNLEAVHAFYNTFLGLPLAVDQGRCRIYKSPSGLIGFCEHYKEAGSAGLVCFVLKDKTAVDAVYSALVSKSASLGASATSEPMFKPEFGIYQFYALDPSGNRIEFQCFE